MKLYRKIASLVGAINNCEKSGNLKWIEKHEDKLSELLNANFPSGSGFDGGTGLDMEKSTSERLVINADFHHMDESGGYDGWTNHNVIVTPSLEFGFSLQITGKDRNDIKTYIGDTFWEVLDLYR